MGSWLGGVRSAGADLGYPGQRLGLPESGPGSVGGIRAALLAFAVDALRCDAVALLLGGLRWNIVVFFVEVFVLTALTGHSAGQRICGVKILRLDGESVGFVWALVRTVLLCLLVPALIWDRDWRGLHDRAANTVAVRR
ncbi:MAG: RDD family protein [Streptosporangiales bacterium]|nr:RDD family protein [Streptosporangiales bacterium]